MMKKHILYLSIFVSVFYSACNLDSFQQVVEFDVPDEKPRLVVNCEYVNNSDSIQVFVSKSWNTGKDLGSTAVKDAKVELWDGTQKIVDVPYRLDQNQYNQNLKETVGSQSYYSVKVPKSLEADKVYSLKVSASGLESVEAKCAMPKLIKINKATYTKKGFKPKSGGFGGGGGIANNLDLISVEFDDVPNETNYYVLKMVKTLRDTATNKLYYSQDAFRINQTFSNAATNIFDDGGDYIYDGAYNFTDELFDGKKFIFKIGLEDNFFFNSPIDEDGNYASLDFNQIQKLKTEGFEITMYSQSKERYYFSNSLESFYSNEGNPFGEPIPLYTNFDKGFGLFSLFDVSKIFVKKK